MSRFLFVVPPLVGHVNPVVGVASELAARGHVTAWVGFPEVIEKLAGPEARVFACTVAQATEAAGALARPPQLRGPAALKFLWQDFLVPLAEMTAPDVVAAVERFRPDVLVVDQQAVAGALVAERLGLPWATSATTSAELGRPLDSMPMVDAWLHDLLNDLRGRIGDPAKTADPRFSPHLILAFTTAELAGAPAAAAGPVRFVGPSIIRRPPAADFPWDWLDPGRQRVLVTLGTVNLDAGATFLMHCQEALAARSDRLQAVIADPGGLLPDPGSGPDILVLPVVPQLELLPHTAAVVCHAGHNTVCEALWHGVPLVVAPIRDDQPVVAEQVVAVGAGVRLRFGRATAVRIGRAVDTVLGDPAHRAAAERVAASFRTAGGAAAAATHLERLDRGPQPVGGRIP